MKLEEFIVKGNRNGYMNNAEYIKNGNGSSRFDFNEGNLIYSDVYFGEENFFGETLVLMNQIILWKIDSKRNISNIKNKVLLWKMNYRGNVLMPVINELDLSVDGIYDFLKKSLRNSNDDEALFRGPSTFKDRFYLYECNVDGNVGKFSGEESIYFNKIKVYEGSFCGRKF